MRHGRDWFTGDSLQIAIAIATIPFFLLFAFSNRFEGKFAIVSSRHDNRQSIPMRAMFQISMEFARRTSIRIMISQGTIKKGCTACI